MTDTLGKKIKTKLNLHIVKRKRSVINTMHVLSFIVSVISIAAIIIYHGCYLRASVISFIRGLVYFSLAFYIFKYFLLMLYSLHKLEYIRKSWFECIIIAVLLIHFILYWLFGCALTTRSAARSPLIGPENIQ